MSGRRQTDRSDPKLNEGPEVLGLVVHIMLLVAILMVRPYGLFGTPEIERL